MRPRVLTKRGQGIMEYAIVLVVIAVVVIGVITVVGKRTTSSLCEVGNGLAASTSIVNGDFEAGTPDATPPGWSAASVAPLTSTTQPHTGAQSLSVAITANSPSGDVFGPPMAACGGTLMRFSGWYRAGATAAGMYYRVHFYNRNNVDVSGCCQYDILSAAPASTTWQVTSGTRTVPLAAVSLRVELWGYYTPTDVIEYWDDVTAALA